MAEVESVSSSSWDRFRDLYCQGPGGIGLDISRMGAAADFVERNAPEVSRALDAMAALEAGAIANPDEGRMVGHYWLRAPHLAPTPEIAARIRATRASVSGFAAEVHAGVRRPPTAERFSTVLSIGIGGSALGPMFVADALGRPGVDRMSMSFIDNTDPDGIARELDRLAMGRAGAWAGGGGGNAGLAGCLVLVISKSGGTPETRNGMLVVAEAYRSAGLAFPAHAVAVTGEGSNLDRQAASEGWLARFPMWDWVGGRTSLTSAVGLLPAALQGLDVDGLLAGAAEMDAATRERDPRRNPAALMALMWLHASEGRGARDLVILPYKDRLLLLSRYLQQLIMESIGKRLDLQGRRVDQGLTVYGNKGSTDQHAYVQQLRDGVPNFFATFIRVLEDQGSAALSGVEVEPGVTAGDYLHGFLLGTREALSGNERRSMTLTVPRVDARTVGAIIALFERATGLYASLIGINAYHQPGVEAGKKAAAAVLALRGVLLRALTTEPRTAPQIAAAAAADPETCYLLLEHLAANGRARRIAGQSGPGSDRFAATGL